MIGRLEPAIGSALRVGPVVEATAGERTAQALMKEREQESNLDAFCREAVGIVSSVPLQEASAFTNVLPMLPVLNGLR